MKRVAQRKMLPLNVEKYFIAIACAVALPLLRYNMEMMDTPRHQGLRKRLMNSLHGKGITDENVLSAMNRVPRHLFAFDSAFTQRAYEDNAFPIGEGQTISQPFTVAYQTQM